MTTETKLPEALHVALSAAASDSWQTVANAAHVSNEGAREMRTELDLLHLFRNHLTAAWPAVLAEIGGDAALVADLSIQLGTALRERDEAREAASVQRDAVEGATEMLRTLRAENAHLRTAAIDGLAAIGLLWAEREGGKREAKPPDVEAKERRPSQWDHRRITTPPSGWPLPLPADSEGGEP